MAGKKFKNINDVDDGEFIKIWLKQDRNTAKSALEYRVSVTTACKIIKRAQHLILEYEKERTDILDGNLDGLDEIMAVGLASIKHDILKIKDPERRLKVIVGIQKHRKELRAAFEVRKPCQSWKGIRALKQLSGGEEWSEVMGGDIPPKSTQALMEAIDSLEGGDDGVHLSELLDGYGDTPETTGG